MVEYEEDGNVRYPGTVIAYSVSEGLCVRFDGYVDPYPNPSEPEPEPEP